jgi:hypothetical protein
MLTDLFSEQFSTRDADPRRTPHGADSADAMNSSRLPFLLPWVQVNLLICSITWRTWPDLEWQIVKSRSFVCAGDSARSEPRTMVELSDLARRRSLITAALGRFSDAA